MDAADAATSRALHVALNAGLENWFRMALRDLARLAAARSRFEDATLLLGASRRNMPAYGSQIKEDDRWAIVAYVRALERSQGTTLDDVPPEIRGELR